MMVFRDEQKALNIDWITLSFDHEIEVDSMALEALLCSTACTVFGPCFSGASRVQVSVKGDPGQPGAKLSAAKC